MTLMTDRDPTIPSTPDFLDTVTVYELLDRGELEAAIAAVKKLSYNSLTDFDKIQDLKIVLSAIAEAEGSVRSAVELFNALIPRPKPEPDTSDWQKQFQKKYEESFYDYMIQDLVIAALKQKDFETASNIVDRMYDWYVGDAMGGNDLLDLAYGAEDPAILASFWALVAKRWGNGLAAEAIPILSESITDKSTIDAINTWLDETPIAYRIPG